MKYYRVPDNDTTKVQKGDKLRKEDVLLLWRPFGCTASVRTVVIARGVIGGLGFVMYYHTISVLPLGDAIALFALHPAITDFVARIFLGETLTTSRFVAALASAARAILIAKPTFIFGNDDIENVTSPSSLGYLTAVLGVCCSSGVFILIRKAGHVGAHTLQLLFSWATFGVTFGVIFGAISSFVDSTGAGGNNNQWHVPTSKKS